jgi:hypothetical protein
MKAFLLSHSSLATPEYIRSVLNTSHAVTTWISPFPYSAIVLSNLTVDELSAIFRTHLGETWFILAELSAYTCNGYLPGQCWDYVNDPIGSWSEQILAQLESTTKKIGITAPSLLPAPSSSTSGKKR